MSQTPHISGGCRERPNRQEVAEAKERESALRSRRDQLVKGALNLRTKRAVRPPPKVQRSEPDRAPRCASFRTSFVVPRVFSCVFAACCGTKGRILHLVCGVCAVLRTGCRVQNASRMLLVVRCPLPAAHGMRRCRVSPVAFRTCSRPLACRLLSDARCLLHALPVACRLLRGVSRMPQTACCPLPGCLSFVACCLCNVVCGLLHARCPLHVASHVVVVRCMLHEVCSPLPVFRCPPQCPMSHGVCCPSPVPSRIVTLHGARSLSHVGSCPLPVPSCTLPVACRLLPVAE